jgi:superfamily I DNA/RNA helicase
MKKAWDWDKEQLKVIESPVGDHILVDAGPGTGKTAVACGRVAWLIDSGGVLPVNIWLISFTRTAVQEIRDRIKAFLKDEIDAYSVRIATLDSHAWMIHSGFDRSAKLLGKYEDNIKSLTDQIIEDQDGEISEYLQNVQHLIVDEGQDFVGIRADLVLEIIDRLSDQCGITIFSDIAQAIYGFSLDDESRRSEEGQKTLLEKIADKFGDDFKTLYLKKVFRTQSNTLEQLYTVTRQKVMNPTDNPLSRLSMICQEIRDLADDGAVPGIGSDGTIYQDNSFILFRRRAEVLIAAAIMGKRPHRIRMSGLPQCIYP